MSLPANNDFDLDPGLSGLGFREEANDILASILSLVSSAAEPAVTYPFMFRGGLETVPNQIQVRNPSNNAFLKLAEITDTDIKLFSEGDAVPSLGSEQIFTEAQSIDQTGVPGSFSVGSDLSAGVVARIPLFGHNASGTNVPGVSLVCRIGTNTAGNEDFTFEIEVVRGGSTVTAATLGSLSDFRRAGGGGIVDADVLRQDGTTLEVILRETIGRLFDGGTITTDTTPVQSNEGSVFRFSGSSDITVFLQAMEKGTVMYFQNESSNQSSITFAAAAVNGVASIRTSRLTLPGVSGEGPTCAVHWYLSGGTRVNIFGNNI